MSSIKNEAALRAELATIDKKIDTLNNGKIMALFNAIGLTDGQDLPKDFLKWETILIVVPTRAIMNELKYYKFAISRIAFATNVNADKITIYDLEEWKKAFRHKTQLQIRTLLKTTFGGVAKISDTYSKDKPSK